MKSWFRIIVFIITILCTSDMTTWGNQFSYVYIQGDKKTPIYVKLDGTMLPRYGKNYAIISELAPGPAQIEILFQQNSHPAQTFNILIPENGKRSFILTQKGDAFTLYDLEQNFHLAADNNIEDDHLPQQIDNEKLLREYSSPTATKEPSEAQIVAAALTEEPKTQVEPTNTTPESTGTDALAPSTTNESPQFIENIVFDNGNNNDNGSGTGNTNNLFNNVDQQAKITNSDCVGAISIGNFNRLLNGLRNKKGENERIGLVQDASKNNCFSCEQVEQIAQYMDSEEAKFISLRSLYKKVTNQELFSRFEALFQDENYKEAFNRLIDQNK